MLNHKTDQMTSLWAGGTTVTEALSYRTLKLIEFTSQTSISYSSLLSDIEQSGISTASWQPSYSIAHADNHHGGSRKHQRWEETPYPAHQKESWCRVMEHNKKVVRTTDALQGRKEELVVTLNEADIIPRVCGVCLSDTIHSNARRGDFDRLVTARRREIVLSYIYNEPIRRSSFRRPWEGAVQVAVMYSGNFDVE